MESKAIIVMVYYSKRTQNKGKSTVDQVWRKCTCSLPKFSLSGCGLSQRTYFFPSAVNYRNTRTVFMFKEACLRATAQVFVFLEASPVSIFCLCIQPWLLKFRLLEEIHHKSHCLHIWSRQADTAGFIAPGIKNSHISKAKFQMPAKDTLPPPPVRAF